MAALTRWAFGIAAAMTMAAACDSPCGKQDNVGGGKATFDAAVAVQVGSLREVGETSDWAEILGVDQAILETADATQPVHVVVGRGREAVEAHALMMASAEAATTLASNYELEPFLLDQVRLKPPQGRARCMLLRQELACALGDAGLGRGTFGVQRYVRSRADAGVRGDVSLSVIDERVFGANVLPILRANIERALTRAKAPPVVRTMVLDQSWPVAVELLKKMPIVGETTGGRFHLVGTLEDITVLGQLAAGAPILSPAAGFVASSWRHAGAASERALPKQVSALADHLGTGAASAIRMRDGAVVRLFSVRDVDALQEALAKKPQPTVAVHGGLLTLSDDPTAATAAAKLGLSSEDPEALGSVMIDLTTLGGRGDMRVSVRRASDGREAAIVAELSRASLLSLVELLTRPGATE